MVAVTTLHAVDDMKMKSCRERRVRSATEPLSLLIHPDVAERQAKNSSRKARTRETRAKSCRRR